MWDPARNYWKAQNDDGNDFGPERPSAYVFNPNQVWNGIIGNETGTWLCNGLVRDWVSWQKEKGKAFDQLKNVLDALSSSSDEPLQPGEPTRISLDDARDIPTIRMPYGLDVPVLHASSGMRRIIALAYLLVWAWSEHQIATLLTQSETTNSITFLIDEIESHLHPSWQKRIVPALLPVMNELSANEEESIPSKSVQVITVTHSPLIMASIEQEFDEEHDAWFDIDYVAETPKVQLNKKEYEKRGDVANWLTGEAFDLDTAYSKEAEDVIKKVEEAMRNAEELSEEEAQKLDEDLKQVLGATDPFWIRWRYVAEKKGWLS